MLSIVLWTLPQNVWDIVICILIWGLPLVLVLAQIYDTFSCLHDKIGINYEIINLMESIVDFNLKLVKKNICMPVILKTRNTGTFCFPISFSNETFYEYAYTWKGFFSHEVFMERVEDCLNTKEKNLMGESFSFYMSEQGNLHTAYLCFTIKGEICNEVVFNEAMTIIARKRGYNLTRQITDELWTTDLSFGYAISY